MYVYLCIISNSYSMKLVQVFILGVWRKRMCYICIMEVCLVIKKKFYVQEIYVIYSKIGGFKGYYVK